MAPRALKPFEHADVGEHTVSVDDNYYALDKSAIVHFPHPSALTFGNADALRCFVMPQRSAFKLDAISSSWVVWGDLRSVVLPKVVSFKDGREKCIAVFFRQSHDSTAPRVVCLRMPLVSDNDVVVSDDNLVACKLSQIADFSPIKNESGGSLLTHVNKYLSASSLFKHFKLDTVKAVHAFVQATVPSANIEKAFVHLELAMRRAKKTTRVGEKEPRSRAAQEDEEAEKSRLKEEKELLDAMRAHFSKFVLPASGLPVNQRMIVIPETITDESAAAVHVETLVKYEPSHTPCMPLHMPRANTPLRNTNSEYARMCVCA